MATLQTMYPAKLGSPKTTLAAGLTADATAMVLVDASVLPPAPNLAVIGVDENCEIVSYTAIDSTTNTVSGLVRGLGDSTARVWTAGDVVCRPITSVDHTAFKANIEALNTAKQEELTFDTTPTAGSSNPVTSGGVKTALDEKSNTGHTHAASDITSGIDTAPTANSTNLVTSGGVKTALDKEILYFTGQSCSVTSVSTAEFCRITDSRISANTVVLECVFSNPSAITSDVSWESFAAGYISLKGICTSNTNTVNIVLGQKGN